MNEPEDSKEQKTKHIYKNSKSAKLSRERKKMYIDLLESKANKLKEEITQKRNRIIYQKNQILNELRKAST